MADDVFESTTGAEMPSSTVAERGRGERSGARTAGFRLAAYTFLILFFELALIRYLPANVKVFSYYTNFVLIAAFVGMGAGLIAAHQSHRLRWAFPILALLLLGLAKWFSNVLVVAPEDPDEYLWAVFFETSPTVTLIGTAQTVTLIFAACALFFVPLGALVGEEFRRFRPLVAYSVDIGGSLAGILVFGLISFLGWPPWLWFAVGFVVLVAASLHHPWYAAAIGATAALAVGLVIGTALPNERWSPYYRIDWQRTSSAHYTINVNGSLHLTAVDFSENAQGSTPWVQDVREKYLRPVQLAERLDTVLVLGAGAGNDVALLLDIGAGYIDAVEIDPDIIQLGHALHFQEPYADPRVHVHVNDARAFLRETPHKYDLVVFGTLDSQTLLSGMSSVRLDNYVYTREALRSAKDVLAPGGTLIMYHMSHRLYIAAKIFQLLNQALGQPPRVFHWDEPGLFNYAFVAGDRSGEGLPAVSYPPDLRDEVRVPTDDWPFLYLARRILPLHYVKGLLGVLLFSTLLVLVAGGRRLRGGADLEMFLLGLGFLLLETKSVTEMSLLFGSTWKVNLLVFSSILLMILLANWLVLARAEIRLRPILLALLVSLLVGYVVPVRALSGDSLWLEWILGGTLIALPIFFAGLTFATLFKDRPNPVRSLGYNLFGAALGGVVEYSVMLIGIKNLYLLAAVAYSLVWLSTERGTKAAVALDPARA